LVSELENLKVEELEVRLFRLCLEDRKNRRLAPKELNTHLRSNKPHLPNPGGGSNRQILNNKTFPRGHITMSHSLQRKMSHKKQFK